MVIRGLVMTRTDGDGVDVPVIRVPFDSDTYVTGGGKLVVVKLDPPRVVKMVSEKGVAAVLVREVRYTSVDVIGGIVDVKISGFGVLVSTETIPDDVVVTTMGDGVRVTTVSEAGRVPVRETSTPTVGGQERLGISAHVVILVVYTIVAPRVIQRRSVVVYVLVTGGRVIVVN